jgi:peptidoglycan hydrolase CwlO-like protein
MKPFVMKGMMMSKETKLERTEVANSALDFLLARLQSEIDELDKRIDTLFVNINELQKRNDG